MKREIKFKAQRLDGKGWVVGQLAYFFDSEKTPYIMPNCYFGTRELGEYDDDDDPILSDEIALGGFIAVNPETVCQFTGLLDKYGKEIFEGDIVNGDYVIEFSDGCFWACCMSEEDNNLLFDFAEESEIELTSNIHDK
jgi:uncharacterized phage protein (TIGR01671 family)